MSDSAKDLVRHMLEKQPDRRFSAFEALRHPWITETATIDKVCNEVTTETLRNLQAFQGDQRIKAATMAFIARQLTNREEKSELEKIFKLMDEDGNGLLDKAEVIEGYEKHFGVSLSQSQVN